jgi:WD40 repeat protein
MVKIDFNENRKDIKIQETPRVTALSFDRCAEALAAGSNDAVVSIFDIRTAKKIRNLNCHSDSLTSVSFCRSIHAPYLVATGSRDKSVIFHDVR